MAITAQTYNFHCRFVSEARLPGYLGSTLRGALGWALKKTSCALRHQKCESCLLRAQCAYSWIFETEQYQAGDGRPVNARPHPFVLQPQRLTAGVYRQGETFSFSLLLIDRACEFLPQIARALQLMAETGIGTGRRQGFGRFELMKIFAGQQPIYAKEDNMLTTSPALCTIELAEPPSQNAAQISIELDTPLRLKEANRLKRALPFHILIRAALRRIAALEEAYGGGEPELDYRGLVKRAEQTEMTASTIRWKELFRFSNRQRKKISLSGLVGQATYSGDLREFVPILDYAAQVNIGKQTVFGLGAFHITGQQTEAP
jgi:CRISPR/Cas system endoribonuclease Cas6 (RAMP superfamily)